MRRIRTGATTNGVSLGEVIEYDAGDGVYHKVVAVPKDENTGCDGCYFEDIDKDTKDLGCIVYYVKNGMRIEMSLCCMHPGEVLPFGKFCKFIKTGDMMEEL